MGLAVSGVYTAAGNNDWLGGEAWGDKGLQRERYLLFLYIVVPE